MREFAVSGGGLAVTGSTTMAFLNPPAAPNINIEVLRIWLGQTANATSAQQRAQLVSQIAQFPTLTLATPAKLKRGDPTVSVLIGSTTGAAATAGINSSADGTGTQTAIFDDAFNVLNGWLHVPTPAETISFPAGSLSGFGVKFPVAPSTLTNWAVGVNFREFA